MKVFIAKPETLRGDPATTPEKIMEKNLYSRILLKLSGETLNNASGNGYDPDSCRFVAERVKFLLDAGVEVAIVVGAGNLWRGAGAAGEMNRVDADKNFHTFITTEHSYIYNIAPLLKNRHKKT